LTVGLTVFLVGCVIGIVTEHRDSRN
jgi:hypothetical protein